MEKPFFKPLTTGVQTNMDQLDTRNDSSFFAKVMFCFGLALLLSAAGTYAGFSYLGPLYLANPGLMWIFYGLELALVLTARAWSKNYPINYLLFGLFAFITGLTIAPLLAGIILEFGGPAVIIKALMASTLTFSAAAIFGWTTHRNLSGLQGFLWTSLIGMFVVSIIGIFVPWSNHFEIIFSGFGVILFSAYVMYDVQQLKGYPPDRYIDAALRLYLDMFNLFIFVLRILTGLSRD